LRLARTVAAEEGEEEEEEEEEEGMEGAWGRGWPHACHRGGSEGGREREDGMMSRRERSSKRIAVTKYQQQHDYHH
jgi:hypothetical protein